MVRQLHLLLNRGNRILTMSIFTCYFLDEKLNNNPQLSFYSDFFLNYSSLKWDKGAGDGVFNFIADNGDKADLTVVEHGKKGISVRYNFRKHNERRGFEYYSIASPEQMNHVEDVGDDQFVPLGSFLKPKQAWLAVEDFFNHPLSKSNRIEWLNSDNINWPDDY